MYENLLDKDITFIRIVRNDEDFEALGIKPGSFTFAHAAGKRLAKARNIVPNHIEAYATDVTLDLLAAQFSAIETGIKGVRPIFDSASHIDGLVPKESPLRQKPDFSPTDWWNANYARKIEFAERPFQVYPLRMNMYELQYGMLKFEAYGVYEFFNYEQLKRARAVLEEAQAELMQGKKSFADFEGAAARVMTGREINDCFLPREGGVERMYTLFAEAPTLPALQAKVTAQRSVDP